MLPPQHDDQVGARMPHMCVDGGAIGSSAKPEHARGKCRAVVGQPEPACVILAERFAQFASSVAASVELGPSTTSAGGDPAIDPLLANQVTMA